MVAHTLNPTTWKVEVGGSKPAWIFIVSSRAVRATFSNETLSPNKQNQRQWKDPRMSGPKVGRGPKEVRGLIERSIKRGGHTQHGVVCPPNLLQ